MAARPIRYNRRDELSPRRESSEAPASTAEKHDSGFAACFREHSAIPSREIRGKKTEQDRLMFEENIEGTLERADLFGWLVRTA